MLETGFYNRAKTANVAIRLAKGKYLVLLEDDLIFSTSFLDA